MSDTATRVSEVMLRSPKTLSAEASIAQARAALDNDHVHMVLLTRGPILVGTVVRSDLPPVDTDGPALSWSRLVDRTVSPEASAIGVQEFLIEQEIRRVAVVSADGTLLGLMCLKRRRTGFCSADDVAARASMS